MTSYKLEFSFTAEKTELHVSSELPRVGDEIHKELVTSDVTAWKVVRVIHSPVKPSLPLQPPYVIVVPMPTL